MRSNRVIIWAIWVLVGVQVLLATLQLLFEALMPSRTGPGSMLTVIAGILTGLANPVVGIIILLHRPRHLIGRLFCLLNLGFAISNCAGAYVRYDLVAHTGALPGLALAVSLYFWPGLLSLGLTSLSLMLFPTGHQVSPRWRYLAWMIATAAIVGAVCSALGSGYVDSSIGVAITNPLGLPEPWGGLLRGVGGFFSMLLVLLFAGVVAAVARRWRQAGPVERQQLKWLVSAVVAWLFMILGALVPNVLFDSPSAMPVWGWILNELGILGSVLIPIACGVAILKYHLYDIDLIIRRTLVYTLLTAILALVYFGSIIILQEGTRSLFGQGQNELVTVISTLFIAALFMPLRRRIQYQVDRRFYRSKYDAAQTLARFGATVRDEVNLDALTEQLVSVVQDTMQPERVSLWLQPRVHR